MATNSAKPNPTGAMKVALCFSMARKKTVRTRKMVRNISMNKPCETEVPPPREVRTVRGPGRSALVMAAATIPPSSCTTTRRAPRKGGIVRMSTRPRVTFVSHLSDPYATIHLRHFAICQTLTAGLNSPPLIRKNTPALTASENPKLKAMYDKVDAFAGAPTLFSAGGLLR